MNQGWYYRGQECVWTVEGTECGATFGDVL